MRIDIQEAGIEAAISGLEATKKSVEAVSDEVLPQLGEELRSLAVPNAPRSTVRRKPNKDGFPTWRRGEKHAADTIVVSPVQRDELGIKFVQVGPTPGDNSPSFYLKFFEFGSVNINPARPFIQPAMDEVESHMADTVAEALNRRLNT